MKKPTSYIVSFILLVILYSCNNRKDPYYSIDDNPVLTVEKLTDTIPVTSFTDSMKLGKPYVFRYNIQSFENLKLNIQKSQLSDSLSVEDNLVYTDRMSAGISTYRLKTVDAFGKQATANVQVTFFKDLSPICNFTVTQVGQVSPYEIDINASSSYDPDARWGGQVTQYEYQVQTDYDAVTDLNDVHYVCDGPGQKKITVRCKDNDGVWSEEKTIYFVLN